MLCRYIYMLYMLEVKTRGLPDPQGSTGFSPASY